MRRRDLFKLTGAALVPLLALATTAEAIVVSPPPPPQSMKIYIQQPGESSAYDPFGIMGLIAYKIQCRECRLQWGEWQKISERVVLLGYRLPTEQEAAAKAVAILMRQRFKLDGEGYFTCPKCQGRGERPMPLVEWEAPMATNWYVQEWKLMQPLRYGDDTVTRILF